jgi:hypothetical protein
MDNIIAQYYDNLTFYKVDIQTDGNANPFAIYACKLDNMLADGNFSYIFAFVPIQYSYYEKAKISELQWQNLQTRHVKDFILSSGGKLRLNPQTFRPIKIPSNLDPTFIVTSRNAKSSKYTSEICNLQDGNCFDLELLNDPKKKSMFQYYNKLSLTTALETFNCCISRVSKQNNDIQFLT